MFLFKNFRKNIGEMGKLRAIKIFFVFPLTGFSTLFVHNKIDYLLGLDEEAFLWQKIFVFVFMVLPVFNLLLYFYGTLFGERIFFGQFIIKKYRWLTGILRSPKSWTILLLKNIDLSSI
jgi:hypothetical protein